MDNLVAIGVGLGLRALVDYVTHQNHRVDGSLVGLWEGAVLRHFISKHPSSLDPYIAYAFRLLVDLLWTSNWMRLFVVVLWTFMGMLLSDVGLDLAGDRRFRKLLRAVRHTVIYPILGRSSHRRTPSSATSAAPASRVHFFQVPPTTSTTSTARSPPLQPLSPSNTNPPARSGAATPATPRRPALRVPGSFSDRWSETDTDAGRVPSVVSHQSSLTSRTSSSRTPSVTFSVPLVTTPSARSSTHPSPVVPVPVPVRIPPPPSGSSASSDVAIPPRFVGVPRPFTLSDSASSDLHASRAPSPPVPIPIPYLPNPPVPISIPHLPSPRPRTPSELEYVTIPTIPDIPPVPRNIQQINPVRPVPSDDERSVSSSLGGGHADRSGLTTPVSDRDRPRIGVLSPEPVHSGLTTPDRPPMMLPPPVTVLARGTPTPSVATADLSDAVPIPIPLRVHSSPPDEDSEQLAASLLHPELLPDISTPQPSPGLVPPAQYLPDPSDPSEKIRVAMPVPDVPPVSEVGMSRLSTTEPPPAYERTPGEADSSENTPAGSVISNVGDRTRLVQRAETLRKTADDVDKRRGKLKQELQEARRNRDAWAAFRLKHEVERAEKETRELHAKAARRFYQAHNIKPEPQTIDVHRLKVTEALEKVEQALYDSIVTNTPELRIITGRGNHSKHGIPALKLAIIGAMADHHIDINSDLNNPGVLVIRLPSTSIGAGAGPSTSS